MHFISKSDILVLTCFEISKDIRHETFFLWSFVRKTLNKRHSILQFSFCWITIFLSRDFQNRWSKPFLWDVQQWITIQLSKNAFEKKERIGNIPLPNTFWFIPSLATFLEYKIKYHYNLWKKIEKSQFQICIHEKCLSVWYSL